MTGCEYQCNLTNNGVEVCDGVDNDCDGKIDGTDDLSGDPAVGITCFGDPDGECAAPANAGTTACVGGQVTCAGPNVRKENDVLEACNNKDDDCDGLVDDNPVDAGGVCGLSNIAPCGFGSIVCQGGALACIGAIFTYEASRPDATVNSPGNGNGYHCSGASCVGVPVTPAGETLDKTKACSVPSKIPWFNVSPIEVEQTCQALGGTVCNTTAQWRKACESTQTCTWGYNPAGAACKAAYTASKFCNLGPSFDFNAGVAGDQDGLLPTSSASLLNCWADWTGALPNNKVFDITGNLREITKSAANTYPLMGGAFNTVDPNGATCQFQFYTVDQNYKLFDVGFRCCFSSDPTL